MDWNRIEGNWPYFKGGVIEQWGKLTQDQLDDVEGRRQRLVAIIQDAYYITRDEADKQLSDWQKYQALRSARNSL